MHIIAAGNLSPDAYPRLSKLSTGGKEGEELRDHRRNEETERLLHRRQEIANCHAILLNLSSCLAKMPLRRTPTSLRSCGPVRFSAIGYHGIAFFRFPRVAGFGQFFSRITSVSLVLVCFVFSCWRQSPPYTDNHTPRWAGRRKTQYDKVWVNS